MKSNLRKKGVVWVDSPGKTVYHGGKMLAAAEGGWLHCVHSQEAENNKCVCLEFFIYLIWDHSLRNSLG